ncbi:sporulation protein [Gottfriedia luciferensis]|uniref:sporulation protein n=1 Tax=Gottfriedia luciferensis TaxID=178774 RepID=UPI000B42F2DB|nr:sporulation protein [Gottfriedia luciferensis]
MFKKVLAKLGIGAATVNTIIHTRDLYPGKNVEGVVEINGGSVAQEINHIALKLKAYAKRKSGDSEVSVKIQLHEERVSGKLQIEANEKKVIPFSFQLPYYTPITIGHGQVWIETDLDIDLSIDPTDIDYLKVHAHEELENFVEAFTILGFRLRQVEVEAQNGRFYQEWEFVPKSKREWRFDEIECMIEPNQEGLYMRVAVDKAGSHRGLTELLQESLGLDEKKTALSFKNEQLHDSHSIAKTIRAFLLQYN